MESSPSSSGRPPSHPQGARAPLLMRRNPTPRADLSMDDNTVKLLRAAYAGDVPKFKKLAKRLEKAGKSMADVVVGMEAPWDRGYGPLHYAAVAWKVEMCKFLIKDLKFDVDTTEALGVTPLMLAIQYRGLAVARLLLVHGADPNKAASNGVTPLHMAACLDTCEGADLLLSNGAYVDPMWEEKTPLYLACQCGNDRMMELLLQHQADPNAVVLLVYTPLKAATYAHSLKAVELLIKAGADVNAGQPVTPLMVAALAGYTECIKCLLKAGADANIPDDKGTLPVEIAAIQGWQECVEILFPVTAPLTRVADWSIDGITQHAKIIRSKAQGYLLQEDGKPDFEADGDAALYERDYAHALTLYTKAVEADPDNSTLYAKMSLCSLHAGDKGKALDYAGTYKGMRPDLSKSCSAQGAALILMKEYGRACEALMSGLRLDFESKPTDIASSGDHL
ncbi:hypothetical protein SETIT_2G162100v2 [Setaria italica]|uniref:Uncharacterized protein n=1 Tax=Setaria italica TaxID=4555 RepID=K3ZZC1_SETIT|nr:hypothetical protein SETIT_2G162100v2 [Setaria italica]